jgi:type I restriction enzyme R subunit
MPNFISEDDIEKAILKKLNQQYGYELLNCHTVDAEDLNDGSNRADKHDVIFEDRLWERHLAASVLCIAPGRRSHN